jgi:hypothetical protein
MRYAKDDERQGGITMKEITAERLIALGGKLWEKGDMKRVYFNYEELANFYGLKYDGWKYTVDGEKVSNNSGHQFASALRDGKFWFDLVTGEFASKGMSDKMHEKIVDRIMEAITQADATKAEAAEAGRADESSEPAVIEAPKTTAGYDVQTAAGPGIQNRPVRTNKKPGRCRRCGAIVPPGEGYLYYIDPDEAYEVSGWIVEHMDKGACQAQLEHNHRLLTEWAKAYTRD